MCMCIRSNRPLGLGSHFVMLSYCSYRRVRTCLRSKLSILDYYLLNNGSFPAFENKPQSRILDHMSFVISRRTVGQIRM